MTYDEGLSHYYNNNQLFLQKRLDPSIIRDSKLFEKTQIRWFDINELAKRRSEFRDFYRNIVDLILEKKAEIIALAKRSLTDKKYMTKRNKKTRRYGQSKAKRQGRKTRTNK
jgi:hypothetical protein